MKFDTLSMDAGAAGMMCAIHTMGKIFWPTTGKPLAQKLLNNSEFH